MCCRNHSYGDSLKLESVGLHNTELCARLPPSTLQLGVGRRRARDMDLYIKTCWKWSQSMSIKGSITVFRAVLEGSSASPARIISVQTESNVHWGVTPECTAENTLILKHFFSLACCLSEPNYSVLIKPLFERRKVTQWTLPLIFVRLIHRWRKQISVCGIKSCMLGSLSVFLDASSRSDSSSNHSHHTLHCFHS